RLPRRRQRTALPLAACAVCVAEVPGVAGASEPCNLVEPTHGPLIAASAAPTSPGRGGGQQPPAAPVGATQRHRGGLVDARQQCGFLRQQPAPSRRRTLPGNAT